MGERQERFNPSVVCFEGHCSDLVGPFGEPVALDNINKNKLDNIFEEDNENKPEEKKVIEIENPKEQIEINKEIIPPTQNIEEEKQKEQNNIFTNNETDKENIPNANKNKGFNSLFDLPEEEKNSTEVIGNKNEQKALETKKKINKIFFDDDDE